LVVMNGVLVEQVGTPVAVYDRPASLFVASFIVSPPMNLVPIDVLRAADSASSLTLRPAISTWPSLMVSSPAIMRSRV
ncbi:hypothetical protein ACC686_37020, partial [Rhizobium johnstonii]